MPFLKTILLPDCDLQALCAGDAGHHSAVIVLHGLGVSKEVQIPELERLRHSGFFAMALDAPHHGARADGLMDVFNKLHGHERHHVLLSFVLQQIAEVTSLVQHLKSKNYKKVAVTGISMGGHVAFGLLRMESRPDLIAPFIGTPDYRIRDNNVSIPPSPAEISGPADHYESVFPASLFIVNAGKDSVVPPGPSRKFVEKIKPFYSACPEKLEYHEYPDSDHMMKPSDWFDAWEKFLARLKAENF